MEDNESVEGMSYDWTSKTLYFVDGAKPAIEMVQVGHREVFYYKLCAASITSSTKFIFLNIVSNAELPHRTFGHWPIENKSFTYFRDYLSSFQGQHTVNPATGHLNPIGHRFRRVVLNKKNGLKKPRGIAVYPQHGMLFYTDWDEADPYIAR